ncbi:unnamed protein product [Jaminaea pallidilutea]
MLQESRACRQDDVQGRSEIARDHERSEPCSAEDSSQTSSSEPSQTVSTSDPNGTAVGIIETTTTTVTTSQSSPDLSNTTSTNALGLTGVGPWQRFGTDNPPERSSNASDNSA